MTQNSTIVDPKCENIGLLRLRSFNYDSESLNCGSEVWQYTSVLAPGLALWLYNCGSRKCACTYDVAQELLLWLLIFYCGSKASTVTPNSTIVDPKCKHVRMLWLRDFYSGSGAPIVKPGLFRDYFLLNLIVFNQRNILWYWRGFLLLSGILLLPLCRIWLMMSSVLIHFSSHRQQNIGWFLSNPIATPLFKV